MSPSSSVSKSASTAGSRGMDGAGAVDACPRSVVRASICSCHESSSPVRKRANVSGMPAFSRAADLAAYSAAARSAASFSASLFVRASIWALRASRSSLGVSSVASVGSSALAFSGSSLGASTGSSTGSASKSAVLMGSSAVSVSSLLQFLSEVLIHSPSRIRAVKVIAPHDLIVHTFELLVLFLPLPRS